MARITIIDGASALGGRLVREAANRGHEVTSYSCDEPTEPVPRVNYKIASISDPDVQDDALARIDAVVLALNSRGECATVHTDLIALASSRNICIALIDGEGALTPPSPDSPSVGRPRRAVAESTPSAATIAGMLDTIRGAASNRLDWFIMSRPADRNPDGGRPSTRQVALFDEHGASAIDGADFAVAVLDEVEHHTERGSSAWNHNERDSSRFS